MLKKLLFAGLVAIASISPSINMQAAPSQNNLQQPPQYLNPPKSINPPTYSDLLKFIDPSIKLPFAKYMADKPYDHISDAKGDYMSKRYKFGDFDCSMAFAVEDMKYTKNENEIEVKLHKFPKYIRLEIPMLFQKNYMDEAQDGIDGKNEKEYVYSETSRLGNKLDYMLVDENFPKKGAELFPFLKQYLNSKGLPDRGLLTEKPIGMSFMEGRLNILEDYFLNVKLNKEETMADITACTLYFPVNDANFLSKKETDKIILKLNPNPKYITIEKRIYDLKNNDVKLLDNVGFTDPKMDSINGNELYEDEYPNWNKNKKSGNSAI